MRQQVLKALANPARIFYVPYTLAVLNFLFQFLLFIVLYVLSGFKLEPLYFLVVVIITHSIMAFFSKKEPQLGQIIMAQIQLIKKKIPRKLAA